ncbi:hypothetical protein [Nonomuraea zeae]|uniref:Uncharacterized protein n=1 Tax=Nonomuraea zeae TaxID=1642303 RepID=A0A5S4GJG2_9ACTN|nr:hypothetical protein [Nonomuraea zeae]TMR33096.1 hypothetical protein ETD85_21055 [Nonomuraea zeae]
MTGPWGTPRGSIARTGVMGLVLLSLLLAACSYARYGGSAAAHPSAFGSGQAWSLGAWDAQLSGLPPQTGGAREHHVLSLWPPLRGERQDEARLALLPAPGLGAEQVRDPQQFAHHASGSRSPPLS